MVRAYSDIRTMATRRVLIVDDEAEVRKTLTDILRAMRYPEPLEVEEVPGGREGLDAMVRQRPDLVLLDLQMPRMDGNGAVAYLPKPFDSRHVEMLVTTVLDSRKPRPARPVPGA